MPVYKGTESLQVVEKGKFGGKEQNRHDGSIVKHFEL